MQSISPLAMLLGGYAVGFFLLSCLFAHEISVLRERIRSDRDAWWRDRVGSEK